MEKYIYISIKDGANLDLSIREDFEALIEKYQSDIEFIEYHLSGEFDEKRCLIEYLE